jgi:hypothetical protein
LRPSDEIIVRSIKEKTLVKLSKEGISPAQKQHFQRVLEIIKEVEKKREREFLIRENVKMALANITRNTEQGRRADVTRQHDYLKQETSFIA